MFVEILDAVQAEIVESEQLQFTPRWVLRGSDLLVGPYHSAEEHEHHVLQTIGSNNLLGDYDDLRFDRQTLILQSCWFGMLERELASDLPFAPWLVAKQKKGLLRLTAPQNFNLEVTDVRWLDTNRKMLLCVYKEALENHEDRLRLRIAQDVDLLFADGKLCGWMLLHPANYLVKGWEDPRPGEASQELAALLYDYFTLVTEPYIEQMEDGDPVPRQALIDLYKRAGHEEGGRLIRASIADVLDTVCDYKIEDDGRDPHVNRCPCCGYKTLDLPPRSFEQCEVCFWTDNAVQFDNPDYRGGPHEVSLNEARANFRKFGAIEERFISMTRKPTEDEL